MTSAARKRSRSIVWLLALAVFCGFFYQEKRSEGSSIKNPSTRTEQHKHQYGSSNLQPMDCGQIFDDDAYFWFYDFHDKRMVVDRARWSGRNNTVINSTEDELYDQIFNDVLPNELFIDVGANVGQITMMGLLADKLTYAFDPLLYDITKLCTGVNENLKRGWVTQSAASKVHIFRSLVGNESRASVSIARPDDAFGKFEQASLFSNTIGVVRKPKLEIEDVRMVRLDEMVSDDIPVGLVKIDVQGYELPVIQGMTGLLDRESGFPHIIHYEEQRRITTGAGFQMGTIQTLLEAYGYACANYDKNNIECKKPRNSSK